MTRPLAGLAVAVWYIAPFCGCGHESVASPGAVKVESRQASQPVVKPVPAAIEAAAPAEVAAAPQEPAPKPVGQRPPADRAPTRPGEAEKITFDDLNLGMQADMVFRPFLLNDRVKELEGKRISIMGYMHAGAIGKGIKEFVLLKNTECKFGPGGQADHLAMIHLDAGQTTEYQLKAIKVEGDLKVEVYNGPLEQTAGGITWAIYRLDNAKIVR